MIYDLIDGFTDEQLEQVLTMLNSVRKMVDEASGGFRDPDKI